MLARSRVIAKGRRIRDIERLVASYGGAASKWTKKSGPPFEEGLETLEFHWYEHPESGRVELKRKKVSEE